ncbi:MAG: hypothetical protein JO061_14975, partial [Acidobacteriaceae bacterium]|nr:hypothetical protein [Acidobacteriaceae bacterium]
MAEQALAVPVTVQAKPAPNGLAAFLSGNVRELAVPLAILSIIVALITPMPAMLLDFL